MPIYFELLNTVAEYAFIIQKCVGRYVQLHEMRCNPTHILIEDLVRFVKAVLRSVTENPNQPRSSGKRKSLTSLGGKIFI